MNYNAIVNAGVALELEVDRLLDPAQFWDHPRDVVDDPLLSFSEKKSILASWASDQCAVTSNSALRQPPQMRCSVTFEEIAEAMKMLDAQKPKTLVQAKSGARRSLPSGRSSPTA